MPRATPAARQPLHAAAYVAGGLAVAMVTCVGLFLVADAVLGGAGGIGSGRLGSARFAQQTIGLTQAFASIFAGVGLLVGLWFTHRRVAAAERTVEQAEKGQLTERFSEAIKLLGDPVVTVRLGGIYALEGIARESIEHRGPVLEVLSSFVRTAVPDAGQNGARAIRPDVQAVLDVLARRDPGPRKGLVVDLRGARLDGARFPPVELGTASFDGVDLTGASLRGATLVQTRLDGARLEDADLSGAIVQNATLTRANLRGARLVGTSLASADLRHADLSGIDATGADFTGCKLDDAGLLGADLRRTTGFSRTMLGVSRRDGATRLPEHLAGPARRDAGGRAPPPTS